MSKKRPDRCPGCSRCNYVILTTLPSDQAKYQCNICMETWQAARPDFPGPKPIDELEVRCIDAGWRCLAVIDGEGKQAGFCVRETFLDPEDNDEVRYRFHGHCESSLGVPAIGDPFATRDEAIRWTAARINQPLPVGVRPYKAPAVGV